MHQITSLTVLSLSPALTPFPPLTHQLEFLKTPLLVPLFSMTSIPPLQLIILLFQDLSLSKFIF